MLADMGYQISGSEEGADVIVMGDAACSSCVELVENYVEAVENCGTAGDRPAGA